MASIATALVEFSDNGNSRTYTAPGHLALKPRIVTQKRVVATTATSVPEDTLEVVYGTTDVDGAILAPKIGISARVRRPVQGLPADVASALALFREIVASAEFEAMITTQNWVKP